MMAVAAHGPDDSGAQERGGSRSRERLDDGGSRSRERDDGGSRSRERRCIVSGEVLDDAALVRFVVGPDGHVVPDVAGKLPGRGLWVRATRQAVTQAAEKNLFSRAARAPALADAALAARTEALLAARLVDTLGLARRAGSLVFGFDNVARALDGKNPPALLIEASDGSGDGKRKLFAAAHARGLDIARLECLSSAELGLALGRENVIHAALNPGGFAARLIMDGARLEGFRPVGALGKDRSTAMRAVRSERQA